MKKNISEVENNYSHLCNELKVCTERTADLEDRLTREKKLRSRVERELEELKEQSVYESSESSFSSRCSSSSDESIHSFKYDTRRYESRSKGRRRNHQKTSKVNGNGKENRVACKERQPDSCKKKNGARKGNETEDKVDKHLQEPNKPVPDEENKYMKNALDYLKKHVNGERDREDNGREFIEESDIQHEKQQSQRQSQRRQGQEGQRQRQSQGKVAADEDDEGRPVINIPICSLFLRTGACTVPRCEFKHMDPNSSYPKIRSASRPRSPRSGLYAQGNKSKQRTTNEVNTRQGQRYRTYNRRFCYRFQNTGYCSYGPHCKFQHDEIEQSPQRFLPRHRPSPSPKICFNFKNTGVCRYGDHCKFSHVSANDNYRHSRHNGQTRSQYVTTQANNSGFQTQGQEYFLGEMKELVSSVKAMVDAHKQATIPAVPVGYQLLPHFQSMSQYPTLTGPQNVSQGQLYSAVAGHL